MKLFTDQNAVSLYSKQNTENSLREVKITSIHEALMCWEDQGFTIDLLLGIHLFTTDDDDKLIYLDMSSMTAENNYEFDWETPLVSVDFIRELDLSQIAQQILKVYPYNKQIELMRGYFDELWDNKHSLTDGIETTTYTAFDLSTLTIVADSANKTLEYKTVAYQ